MIPQCLKCGPAAQRRNEPIGNKWIVYCCNCGVELDCEMIQNYQILDELGGGGMGTVYLAGDTTLGRYAAIKLVSEKAEADWQPSERLIREAKSVARLDHPNICTVYGIGEYKGRRFIAMQYVKGETLNSLIPTMSLKEALNVAVQVADALAEAHSHGIVHRDIKPLNIMITQRQHVKVMDFGLAKLVPEIKTKSGDEEIDPQLTKEDQVIGTAQYMSPERLSPKTYGEVDHRSDIFSFGIVLYEMVTGGKHPFKSDSGDLFETLTNIQTQDPPLLATVKQGLPRELQQIISKTLSKKKEERYQNAEKLRDDLQNLKQILEAETGDIYGTVQSAEESASSTKYRAGRIRYVLGGLALTLLIVLIVFVIYPLIKRPNLPIMHSLAILPLDSAGMEPDLEYFYDGFTEDLIRSVSQSPKPEVLPYSSVAGYKGKQVDPQEAGRALSVDKVATGRFTQQGDELIVQLSVVHVPDGVELLDKQYSGKRSDPLKMMEEIAKDLLEITIPGETILPKQLTKSTEANELYRLGSFFLKKRGREHLQKSISYFLQAIQKDQNYALAYAGLADAYTLLGTFGNSAVPPKEIMPKAKEAATRALEIDDTIAEAHTSLALVAMLYDWHWADAEKEFKRAFDMDPKYAPAHHWYALYLSAMGRFDEALAEIEQAQRLDPESLIISTNVGKILYFAGHYDKAIAQLNKTLEMDPEFQPAHNFLGFTYIEKGDFHKAIAEFKRLNRSDEQQMMFAYLGYAYSAAENRVEAQKMLDRLKRLSKRQYVSPYHIAVIYAGLGDNEQAFRWLEMAYQDKTEWLASIKVDPRMRPLYSDSRFEVLLRRLGLPQ